MLAVKLAKLLLVHVLALLGPSVETLFEVVGLADVFQQTPLAVTLTLPILEIVPPAPEAVVVPIVLGAVDADTVGAVPPPDGAAVNVNVILLLTKYLPEDELVYHG